MKEKKQITITITDLSDRQKVLGGLDNLFKEIILYYCDQNDLESLDVFVLSIAEYFGNIMRFLGYEEGDFKDGY